MDGISAVTARIAEIRGMVHPAVVARGAVAAPAAAPGGATSATPWGTAGTVPGSTTGASFAASLAAATAQQVDAGPAAGAAGMSVAAFKAAHPNGKVPPSALVAIGRGSHQLAPPAAAAFTRMEAAAARDGVSFGVTDSYRSFESQVDLAQRKGLYSQGGLAAAPGTSQHGWGLAVDLKLDSAAQAWMRANGARFGFVEDVPREPWHWTFKG